MICEEIDDGHWLEGNVASVTSTTGHKCACVATGGGEGVLLLRHADVTTPAPKKRLQAATKLRLDSNGGLLIILRKAEK